jgi:uncharacterized protein (DUF983 family)
MTHIVKCPNCKTIVLTPFMYNTPDECHKCGFDYENNGDEVLAYP